MNTHKLSIILLSLVFLFDSHGVCQKLSELKKDQDIANLHVSNLYSDGDGKIMGAKFRHVFTGAPIYLLQIETVPQAFMWVDAPDRTNRGLAHSLEHLLAAKGAKGRYQTVLADMRLSRWVAASYQDYNFYSFSSGTGLPGFVDEFHALLDALYKPDVSDLEAELEFYHFGVSSNPETKAKTLVEEGSVYDEEQMDQGVYTYIFDMNKRVFGPQNPFGFDISGNPDEMRRVTPGDIRHFHSEHYHLGPTTGFILVVDPKENVAAFLQRISEELDEFSGNRGTAKLTEPGFGTPKYPIEPDTNTNVKMFSFPAPGILIEERCVLAGNQHMCNLRLNWNCLNSSARH